MIVVDHLSTLPSLPKIPVAALKKQGVLVVDICEQLGLERSRVDRLAQADHEWLIERCRGWRDKLTNSIAGLTTGLIRWQFAMLPMKRSTP